MRTLVLLLALAAGQIPTPTRLVEARRVFLTGDGVERVTLQELGQQMAEWGRWTLQADEATSDLVLILSRTPDSRPDPASGVDARGWVLTIREPAQPTPLYSDVQVGSYAAGAVTQLMARLKTSLDGPPAAMAGRLDAAGIARADAPAATPREPCRVFVTEQQVDPSFYTVVKRITYRKKYYGGSSHAWEGMAREGRKVDADAVVAVNINFRPSMFSWASPHAEGIAVKWTDAGRTQFASLVGQCFEVADDGR
jgi:hypothetical protein